MILRTAIIEDVQEEAALLERFIRACCQEHGIEVEVDVYASSHDFLAKFKRQYNILFFDIELSAGESDGMEAAHIVRRQDEQCTIIFVTNLGKYAIEGYRVNASDFILKPITYESFKFRFEGVVKRYAVAEDRCILIKSKGVYCKLRVQDIYYVCIVNHICYFYGTFSAGDDEHHLTCYESWMQLSTVQKEVGSDKFVKCSPSYLINLSRVNKILKDSIIVGATTLPMSRNKKKDVITAYMESFGKR